MTQSEQELEQNLVKRLTGLGYEPVNIKNSQDRGLSSNCAENHAKAKIKRE